ncbi:MAG: hypothetical protein WC709_07330 [Thermoleophilia bacterium]
MSGRTTDTRAGGRRRPRPRGGAWSPWTHLIGVAAFAVAFALVEATVVVYLRRLFELKYAMVYTPAEFHFPRAYLGFEQAREAATMVVLLAVGYLAGRTRWQKLAYWLFAFGVWDIFYYAWLYAYLRWPASPGSQDLLFLIPGEWWAPVWEPTLASCGFIAVAVVVLARTRRAR